MSIIDNLILLVAIGGIAALLSILHWLFREGGLSMLTHPYWKRYRKSARELAELPAGEFAALRRESERPDCPATLRATLQKAIRLHNINLAKKRG